MVDVNATSDDVTAAALVVRFVTDDPFGAAEELARLRESVRTAYAIIHALVTRLGGKVDLAPADLAGMERDGLKTDVDQVTGVLHMRAIPRNRAEKRAMGRR